LVAKKKGIPTFTYQHGLDCEHYFLDDCFANYVAVWSENRLKKYQEYSKIQPKTYAVIGNFLSPTIVQSNKESRKSFSKRIVFITRPHMPVKCYSPSRNYLEGVQILKSILEVMITSKSIKLIIKPHPMDDSNLYIELIDKMNLSNQVELSTEKISKVLKEASIVVTEDSTAGVEALTYNLPCIHAHFANCKPVLPFVEYGAALSGKNSKELKSNLEKALNMSSKQLKTMNVGQQKMIKDFLPKGNVNDLVKFISQNIK